MLADFGFHRIGVALGFMGVDTLGAVHPVGSLAQFPHCRQVVRRHRDGDDLFDVDVPAVLENIRQGLVFQIVQVAVGLNDRVIENGNLATFFAHIRVLAPSQHRAGYPES